jgi:hypothetical protein
MDKRYRIRSPEAVSIRIDWSLPGAFDAMRRLLSLHSRDTLPLAGTPARAEAELRIKTVEIRFPDMHRKHFASWLLEVSLPGDWIWRFTQRMFCDTIVNR